MIKKTALALLACSFFMFGCSNSNQEQQKSKPTNELTLHTIQNQTLLLEKKSDGLLLKGAKKLLLIDIFATWCPPCIDEIGALNSLAKKYPNKLIVVGVSVEDERMPNKLRSFANQHAINYPLADTNSSKAIIAKVLEDTKVGSHFGIPLLVLYKDGKLYNFYQGATEEEFIESDIKKALGK